MDDRDKLLQETDLIIKHFTRNEKPWKIKAYPKNYNWKSSIPESWIKLYGLKNFKKVYNNSSTRISGQNLNNSREFLHTLNNFKPKQEQIKIMPIKRLKTINLADISRKLDLVNQNDYIAQRINKKKSR